MSHLQDQEITKYQHHPCVVCVIENPETHQLMMIKHLRGMNKGFYNFPGGKMDFGEDVFETVRREVHEETGLLLHRTKCVGRIDIDADKNKNSYSNEEDMHVYIFYSDKFSGEMRPAKGEVDVFWQDKDKIPYEEMRDNDKIWVPEILAGKTIHKVFYRDENSKLKETIHDDDNDIEGFLKLSLMHYKMMKMAK